jgi:DNA-binding MarR family transcriptional regulator
MADPGEARHDAIDHIQRAWRRQRPDVDVASIGILSRISRIARYLDRHRHRALAALGTDAVTLDALATLRRSGPPFRLTAGELRRAALITSGAVTQRLDKLEAAGLVRREQHGPDKRVVYVVLTDAGRDLVDATLIGLMRREDPLLAPLTPAERRTLEGLLHRWLLWFERHHP